MRSGLLNGGTSLNLESVPAQPGAAAQRRPQGLLVPFAALLAGAVLLGMMALARQTVIQPTVISGRTGNIGGGLLLAGTCDSGTATVSGAQVGMVATATPDVLPVASGTAISWDAHISALNTVTVRVCAVVAVTPTATPYSIRVIR